MTDLNRRKKDVNWTPAEADGSVPTWERVQVAILMDIRDELKRLNAAIYCQNFLAIPTLLRSIRRNTAKPKKREKR